MLFFVVFLCTCILRCVRIIDRVIQIERNTYVYILFLHNSSLFFLLFHYFFPFVSRVLQWTTIKIYTFSSYFSLLSFPFILFFVFFFFFTVYDNYYLISVFGSFPIVIARHLPSFEFNFFRLRSLLMYFQKSFSCRFIPGRCSEFSRFPVVTSLIAFILVIRIVLSTCCSLRNSLVNDYKNALTIRQQRYDDNLI